MKKHFIIHFRELIYLVVLTGFSVAHAGSYDDFFDAVKNDQVAAIEQLLARGFDVNTLDPQGQHGLALAIREPSPKVAEALIDAPQIDLNALNAQGESPLMLASLKGQLELVDHMVKKGADVNKPGWTPLHYAATNSHLPVIRLLLENHAYIDAVSPNGSTPLMMASMYGSPAAVKLLLDEGADALLKNQQGITALQFAERVNRLDAAELITKAQLSLRSQRPPGKW